MPHGPLFPRRPLLPRLQPGQRPPHRLPHGRRPAVCRRFPVEACSGGDQFADCLMPDLFTSRSRRIATGGSATIWAGGCRPNDAAAATFFCQAMTFGAIGCHGHFLLWSPRAFGENGSRPLHRIAASAAAGGRCRVVARAHADSGVGDSDGADREGPAAPLANGTNGGRPAVNNRE